MKDKYLNFLSSLYADSAILTGIYDLNCNIVWKNYALKKHDTKLKFDNLSLLLGKAPENSGLFYYQDEESIYTVNIIVSADMGFILAEQLKCDKRADVFSIPAVRNYLQYVFSEIREIASSVTIALDEIYTDVIKPSVNGNNVIECLNSIDRNILDLLNDILDPEMLINLAKSGNQDKTVCLSSQLERLALEAKKNVKAKIAVISEIDEAVFTRINKSFFDMLLSDIVSRCILKSVKPKQLLFKLSKLDNDYIQITVEAFCDDDYIIDIPKNDNLRDNMFFSYLCDMFCTRYNGEFSEHYSSSSVCCKIKLKTVVCRDFSVSTPFGYDAPVSRFGPMPLRLVDFSSKRFDVVREIQLI